MSTRVPYRFPVLVALFIAGLGQFAYGQPALTATPSERPTQNQEKESKSLPLGTWEEELKANAALQQIQKEYKENLERAQQLAQIGLELRTLVENNKNVIPHEWKNKVERLRKLAKRIRDEAGGDDDKEIVIENMPKDLNETILRLSNLAMDICIFVETTPRNVVSAATINHANQLLKLIEISRKFPQNSKSSSKPHQDSKL
jgi:hypothetical protein